MLDVNTLPKSYRKVEEFEDDVGQMDVDRKRTEEGRQKYFKTNVRRDGALYGAASAYFLPWLQYS